MQEMRVGSLDLEEPLEKEMATHSSILAWRIPGTKEPDGLPSMGSHRVGHDWSALAAAAAEIISYSVAQLFLIPWTATPQASLSFTISRSLLKLTSIESVMLSNHLLLLPSFFPRIRVFPDESALPIRPKDWSFSFHINPSNLYSELISFRIDSFDLLAAQATLKSLLQHHNSKASTQALSLLHGPTLTSIHDYWKTIALTIWTFVCKVISLLFNMLSRSVIAFLPRSKHILISWLQSLSTVILEPKKIKSATVSTFFPLYLPWSDGTGCHDLRFLNVEF